MIELRQYEPEDYMRIERRKFDAMTFLKFPDPMTIAKSLTKGPSLTASVNGDILFCGGIVPMWKGVGEAWVVTSPLVDQYPFSFAKTVWRKLLFFAKSLEFDRVQTTVDIEHSVSIEWVERMGFVREGLMRKYIIGRDFYRYALIREG